jgi:hypothetical protein
LLSPHCDSQYTRTPGHTQTACTYGCYNIAIWLILVNCRTVSPFPSFTCG